jgi:predicted DNA-binding protein
MGHTITVRLTSDLAEWLEETSSRTGLSQSQIIREQLIKAKTQSTSRGDMRLAGSVRGARDLSSRKGFSRK